MCHEAEEEGKEGKHQRKNNNTQHTVLLTYMMCLSLGQICGTHVVHMWYIYVHVVHVHAKSLKLMCRECER